MTFDAFMRAFLACYFGFVAVHYTARLMGLRARSGIPHAEIGARGSRNASHQILFRVFRSLILGVCIARVGWPGVDAWLLPLPMPAPFSMQIAGFGLMLAGLFLVDYAHSYLGDDWRSGMARGVGERLVTSGPYRLSRNPIFTGVMMGQFGFLLAFPSGFTLVCFGVGLAVIVKQAMLEEAALLARHGEAYARYRAAVPRWFGVGDPSALSPVPDEARHRNRPSAT
ncbi:methyltransferase family protein [Chthonobacter albigriseus]|uniref:methyltransferase family protein n=1 Tax=Chthonobacter albigriseus TaxID=1683161 RepID=UPI0015EEF4CB|nr:isoprenylcysteine carboxylmethyltransferase family protein [Chthonobacter albigriseus]